MNELLKKVTAHAIRPDLPTLKSGQTVIVTVKIVENQKTRFQEFQGMIIKVQNSGIAKNITVRKVSRNITTERIFNLNSPFLDKIEVLAEGHVRRARIYYFRKLFGKNAKLKVKKGHT